MMQTILLGIGIGVLYFVLVFSIASYLTGPPYFWFLPDRFTKKKEKHMPTPLEERTHYNLSHVIDDLNGIISQCNGLKERVSQIMPRTTGPTAMSEVNGSTWPNDMGSVVRRSVEYRTVPMESPLVFTDSVTCEPHTQDIVFGTIPAGIVITASTGVTEASSDDCDFGSEV